MSETENVNKKYGLIEIESGVYLDKKLNKNLTVKQNYVEVSGDEFKKNATAMILYSYEGGKNRTETTEAFVIYGEENLERIQVPGDQLKMESVEADFKEVAPND